MQRLVLPLRMQRVGLRMLPFELRLRSQMDMLTHEGLGLALAMVARVSPASFPPIRNKARFG